MHLESFVDQHFANLWLEKLANKNTESPGDDLPVQYLKLLIFAAQGERLGGIFAKEPPEGDLEKFPESNTVNFK